ncbi:hypothetical protein ThimaDRAFT_0716 [Thiocapsa marina 5811]|uniref:Uncharacterized protein n=1 Tax=Thiocapsa marina 5811 TaxID=768671 RepID=F9U714_9GAMM|nr:hypothetical protein ThimaDRAFT_0716 [Thiocapsa marina 5811]
MLTWDIFVPRLPSYPRKACFNSLCDQGEDAMQRKYKSCVATACQNQLKDEIAVTLSLPLPAVSFQSPAVSVDHLCLSRNGSMRLQIQLGLLDQTGHRTDRSPS